MHFTPGKLVATFDSYHEKGMQENFTLLIGLGHKGGGGGGNSSISWKERGRRRGKAISSLSLPFGSYCMCAVRSLVMQ